MSNKTGPVVAVVVVAAVAVLGTTVYMNMNNNAEDTANQTTNTQTQQQSQQPEQAPTADIVGLASDTPTLSTLVTAVSAASLVETLQGTGPFTVFAPTNTAFEALPAGTLDTLLKPENVDQLKSVLTYHVVSGKVMAADLSDGQQITTVQGGTLTVKIMDGKVYIVDAKGGEAMVQTADVNAKNGVVHVISSVLLQ